MKFKLHKDIEIVSLKKTFDDLITQPEHLAFNIYEGLNGVPLKSVISKILANKSVISKIYGQKLSISKILPC